jgi:putative spermidine/putrescine transport system substrate-binding protein
LNKLPNLNEKLSVKNVGENMQLKKSVTTVGVMMSASLLLAACGGSSDSASSTPTDAFSAATATSAADFGGLAELEAACKAEGKLNVIALPPDWANYGEIIDGFATKYGIAIDSAIPDGSSQDEIDAANNLAGTDRAPDVFDLGQSVAMANTSMFAAYKVESWDGIDPTFKDANGLWVNDYGGFMAIGYDANVVPAITSLDDLLKPEFAGKVALNGDPTASGSGLNGVFMASVAKGGSLDDIGPGIDYFASLKEAGSLLPVDPSPATIESGQTPVVFDWDYLQAGQVAGLAKKGIDWKIFVPEGAVVGGYYFQAINADAPNPSCARLWQEYLYSADGSNGWLRGGARPVLADKLVADITIDAEAFSALPPVTGSPQIASVDQTAAANELLTTRWATEVGAIE